MGLVRAAGAVSCFVALPLLAITEAPACGAGLSGEHRVESPRYALAYRMEPPKPVASKHFSIELEVCAKAGAPAPDAVRVDARMPEHGHGMNYKAVMKSLGGGRFQASGLLFHMPGRWEIVFDVRSEGASDRISHDFVL